MSTALEAGQWSRLLGTPAGKEIEALLGPFHEQAPLLTPPEEPVIEAARPVIRHLAGSVQLAILSVAAVDAAMMTLRSPLPEALCEDLEAELRSGLARALKSSLWDELRLLVALEKDDTTLTHPLWAVAAVGLWLEFRESEWASFQECLKAPYLAPLRRALKEGFEALLCCRLVHLAERAGRPPRYGKPELGERVLPLLQLFAAGNFPVGRLEDGSFLLLVA